MFIAENPEDRQLPPDFLKNHQRSAVCFGQVSRYLNFLGLGLLAGSSGRVVWFPEAQKMWVKPWKILAYILGIYGR